MDASHLVSSLPHRHASISVQRVPRWMLRGYDGMAMPWGIYVATSVADDRVADVLRHELVHVDQWSRLGWRRFTARYAGEYITGRWRGLSHEAAYRAISLEREAAATRRR